LRLIRILRAFRLLRGLSGVKRQIFVLILTLMSLIFLAAGIVQMLENDVRRQLLMKCLYISASTGWLPSCDPNRMTYHDPSCDCHGAGDFKWTTYVCVGQYSTGDLRDQPSGIMVNVVFFVCFSTCRDIKRTKYFLIRSATAALSLSVCITLSSPYPLSGTS